MKLLFENWRQYLNERATDVLYQKIVDFLINTILNKKFFDLEEEPISEEEYEKIMAIFAQFSGPDDPRSEPDSPEPGDPDYYELKEYSLSIDEESGRLDYLWDEYQKKVPEDNKIFIDYGIFETFMSYLMFRIIYAPKEMKDKFESSGMGLYAHMADARGAYWFDAEEGERQIIINYAHFIPFEEYEKINENTLWFSLRSYKKELRSILEHEFTHLLNRARSNIEGSTSKQRGWTKEKIYINSTEEIQARMIQMFQIVEKSLRQPQKTYIPFEMRETIELISLEVNEENIKNTTRYLLLLYDIMFPGYWVLTRKSRKQKIGSRLYEFAQRLIQDKDSYSKIKRMSK